jgi:hypothetical protein
MWCIPEITIEFIERMEDVLNLYEKPYNYKEPVVCLDEKPVQLLEDARETISLKSGKPRKRDYEYVRRGTANVFCIVEPKGGRHFTYVTENRKGKEFAKVLKRIASHYSDVDIIHLVMDNLRTHSAKSLIDFYGEEEGTRIWNKFKVHYTPKHASWLDQAEIEIGIYSRQCLGKSRIGSIDNLRKKTKAWNKEINKKKLKIAWKFTTKDARLKFKY